MKTSERDLAWSGRGVAHLLRSYVRYFPLQRGKDRVLGLFHRRPGQNVVKEIVPGVFMRLDLGEYIQRTIYYFGLRAGNGRGREVTASARDGRP